MSWTPNTNTCAWLIRDIDDKRSQESLKCLLTNYPCGAKYFLTSRCAHGSSAGEHPFHNGALTVTVRTTMTWFTKTVILLLVRLTDSYTVHTDTRGIILHCGAVIVRHAVRVWVISGSYCITEQILKFFFIILIWENEYLARMLITFTQFQLSHFKAAQ